MENLNSWKNKEVFEKQLALNLKELEGHYPAHWGAFITFMTLLGSKVKTILDVGCGAGVYSEICRKHFPNIKYIGMDYSEEAIEVASRQWPGIDFRCKNYKDLTQDDLRRIDVLHACSLHNVLPDGDECLNFMLGLKAKYIILGKILTTNQASFYSTYMAYDLIPTYLYKHNYLSLYGIFKKHGYLAREMQANGASNFLLRDSDDV